MSKTKNVTAAAALKRLQQGNERFVDDCPTHERQDSDRRRELKSGQQPFAVILSCADSRVIPEIMFDTGLGELFVIRVAGNVANTSSIASIEYAVANLGTKLVVVLGHESCGAVTAAIDGGNHGYNLNHLLSHITPSLGSRSVNSVVKKNAQLTAEELETRSGIIAGARGVEVVPAYYELASGKVRFL